MVGFWEGNRKPTATEQVQAAVLERHPAAPKRLTPRVDAGVLPEASIAEYRKVAGEIGIDASDMLVEEFRLFLAKNDIPTFNLGEVVSYMDEMAAKDNPTGFGWQWCPVRAKDAETPLTFGRPSEDRRNYNPPQTIAASDFYASHRFQEWSRGGGGWHGGGGVGGWSSNANSHQTTVHVHSASSEMQAHIDRMTHSPPQAHDWRKMPSPAYTRTLPLHALKKIALIERSFKSGKVVFLVSDYCVAPHVVVNPDPFLMAVIPNSAVAHGKGRFIIDVWDEPGFGIERMVK